MNTTSLAFIVLGAGLALCAWRFLVVFLRGRKLQDSKIALFVCGYLLGFATQTGIVLGVGTLLFAHSPGGLFFVILIAHIFLTLLAILGIYGIFYIFFPRNPIWPPVLLIVLLGLFGLVILLVAPPTPSITTKNSIDWGMNFTLSLITFYLLFLSVGSQAYIFLKLFRMAPTREIAFFGLVLGLIGIGGVISAFLNFVIFHNIDVDIRGRIYATTQGLLGVAFIFFVFWFSMVKKKKQVDQ